MNRKLVRLFSTRRAPLPDIIIITVAVVIIIIISRKLYGNATVHRLEYLESVGSEEGSLNFLVPKLSLSTSNKDEIMRFREERFNIFRNSTPTGLGEWGEPAILNKTRDDIKLVMKKEKFNKVLGDLISLDRKLRDYRIKECRSLTYPGNLPSASVVIVFCNEAPSALLRTVHSVVNTSPPRYLHEVILIDDASDRDDLKSILDGHIRLAYPDGIVKLIRSNERLGLVRGRMMGAEAATGEVLVFLDAHCETTDTWLEPLLNRIQEDRTVVACPLIDLICTYTLGYFKNGGSTSGGFGWNLNFDWMPIQRQEQTKRKNETYPIRAPSMAGGLFAVDRKFFFHLGGYDKGMKIWGGENVEISIRTWMCGGSLELIPCSRVGHLYRSSFPYSTNGEDLNVNSKRVAEVWLDDYKRIFYMHRPDLKPLDVGDLSDRIELRKRLKCKNFKWFLDNVFPELFVPDENVKAYGSICLPSQEKCWDTLGIHTSLSSYAISVFYDQKGTSLNQLFSLDKEDRIRKDDDCLITDSHSGKIILRMKKCDEIEAVHVKYLEETGVIILDNKLCVELSHDQKWNRDTVVAANCSFQENQKWKFQVTLE